MRQSVEQRGGHLRIAKHARPFGKGEIGGDDDRGALVKLADEMKEQLTAGLGKRQITEFVEEDKIVADEGVGEPALPT
jgi:hypothetical protein